MRKTALALILISALLFSATMGATIVSLAKANFMASLPNIVIRSDGSISLETEFINQNGNLYTLTDDISQKYVIIIQCNNIVFDGAGHCINGTVSSGIGYSNKGLTLDAVTNVTVENVEVIGFSDTEASIENCSKCSILRIKVSELALRQSDFNTIAESNIEDFGIGSSRNNVITRNNITTIRAGKTSANVFFENNFACIYTLIVNEGDFWDNGSVGNYWNDYSTKYPNATEIGSTGIGDMPYVIDAKNTDNYPLIKPFKVPSSPPLEPQPEPQPFLTAYVAAASAASAALICAGLLVYFRKRHRQKQSKTALDGNT